VAIISELVLGIWRYGSTINPLPTVHCAKCGGYPFTDGLNAAPGGF